MDRFSNVLKMSTLIVKKITLKARDRWETVTGGGGGGTNAWNEYQKPHHYYNIEQLTMQQAYTICSIYADFNNNI